MRQDSPESPTRRLFPWNKPIRNNALKVGRRRTPVRELDSSGRGKWQQLWNFMNTITNPTAPHRTHNFLPSRTIRFSTDFYYGVTVNFFLTYFIPFFKFWPLLPTHCRCRGLVLHLITLKDTHSVELLWTRDQPVAETSTWQHATLTRDKHLCPRRYSNQQYQQASGRRPTL
jgi:hypothetical protein